MNENILIERNVTCELRDGTKLKANIYRPDREGRFPVLLNRLPYNKDLPPFSHGYIDPTRLSLSGYVVIIQDVRGRYSSEGDFNPFHQERKDGYDAVEWAAKLPYSNGKVGMFGLSYYGFTQLFAAMERPPSLKVIAPAFTGNNLQQDIAKRNGALALGMIQSWILGSIATDYLSRKQGPSQFEKTQVEIIDDLDQVFEWHSYKPIKGWPPLMKHKDIQHLYETFLSSASEDDENIDEEVDIDLPGFHLAGWYDCFLGPTIDNYLSLKKKNNNQKLIIGPWGHGSHNPYFGERYFGLKSSGDLIDGKDDITSLHIKWFDYWLKENKNVAFENEDPIRIFIMGINKWRSEKEWPLARTEYTKLYLHSDGKANVGTEHGTLRFDQPDQDDPHDQYVYDPDDPVPTVGGPTLFYRGVNTGPLAQNDIEQRNDVLVYSTDPLEEPLEVTGPVKVFLYAKSDAPDTDFTVKLTDVLPDGKSINVTEGIVRAKYRHGEATPLAEPLNGEVILYEIDLWATSIVFLKGHSLRISITSSNFPMYDINPNTGKSLLDSTETQKANQQIYHDQNYASYVLLPVIHM